MATKKDMDHILKEHPFFKGMSKDSFNVLCGCAANERVNAGEYIVREGEPADKFYLLRSGSVALEFHVHGRDPIILETLHDGDIFGWSWIVPPYKWSYDIRAISLSRLVALEASCLRKKLEKDHSLGFDLYSRFIPILAKRLTSARLQLVDMYG